MSWPGFIFSVIGLPVASGLLSAMGWIAMREAPLAFYSGFLFAAAYMALSPEVRAVAVNLARRALGRGR